MTCNLVCFDDQRGGLDDHGYARIAIRATISLPPGERLVACVLKKSQSGTSFVRCDPRIWLWTLKKFVFVTSTQFSRFLLGCPSCKYYCARSCSRFLWNLLHDIARHDLGLNSDQFCTGVSNVCGEVIEQTFANGFAALQIKRSLRKAPLVKQLPTSRITSLWTLRRKRNCFAQS